jgi:branched-chain amino acid transport system permease protein
MNFKSLSFNNKPLKLAIVGLLLIALPWIFNNPYLHGILVIIGIYTLVTTGLSMLSGYSGQISLGQAAFYALGAYTSALVTIHLNVSPWIGLLCGAVLTGCIAYLLGKPFLRIRGFYLALVTLTFSFLIFHLLGRMSFLTGGYDGIGGIPHFSFGNLVMDKDYQYYYLLLIIVIAAIFFYNNLINSKIGRKMRAADLFSGGSELAAKSLGVDIGKLKTQIFVICCVYAAVGGSIFAHYMAHIHPEPFSAGASILFLIMMVLGGQRSIWGGLIGSSFYVVIKEILNYAMRDRVGWDLLIYAVLFLLILIVLPKGLASLPDAINSLVRKRFLRKAIEPGE